MTQEKKLTVYQEAVEFRDKVESGEYSRKGYVTIPSFLGLLGYMEYKLLGKLLKDDEIAKLVNELTAIAKTYNGTEQLREHISKCVVKWIKP